MKDFPSSRDDMGGGLADDEPDTDTDLSSEELDLGKSLGFDADQTSALKELVHLCMDSYGPTEDPPEEEEEQRPETDVRPSRKGSKGIDAARIFGKRKSA